MRRTNYLKCKADPACIEKQRKASRDYMRRKWASPEGKLAMQANARRVQTLCKADPACFEKQKARHRCDVLRQRYGLSCEAYAAMLAAQDNQCPICRVPFINPVVPVVDHDHATGAVRAILCSPCNLILGHAKDQIGILNASILYLQKHSTPAAQDRGATSV